MEKLEADLQDLLVKKRDDEDTCKGWAWRLKRSYHKTCQILLLCACSRIRNTCAFRCTRHNISILRNFSKHDLIDYK
jgi:hypothetical protein